MNLVGLGFEPGFDARAAAARDKFRLMYGREPSIGVRSPGRAEIIGNHTDYNGGFAIGCAIGQSIVAFFDGRHDREIRIFSANYPGAAASIDLSTTSKKPSGWEKYAAAVAAELGKVRPLTGADIYLESSIPAAGGLSTSAALEVAIALGLQALNGIELTRDETAVLCRRAENGPLVNVPCGILDQGTVLFSEPHGMVFFDFGAPEDSRLLVELIPTGLEEAGLVMILTMDSTVERRLGESAYAARREQCERSLPKISSILGRPVRRLRDVTVDEFLEIRTDLERSGGIDMRRRVEHVVFENERVLSAASALREGDFQKFGKLMSGSGESALTLYDLAQDTPELTALVEHGRTVPGVLGIRNMGGGFSALALSLVEKKSAASFEESMLQHYGELFGRALQFIRFVPSGHAALFPMEK